MLIDFLKKHLRPYLHLPGYMNRWWIWGPRIDPKTGKHSKGYRFAVRLHEILRSDQDRWLHDHPWPYITVILSGGYWETVGSWVDGVWYVEKTTWRGPGSILFRKASSRHRLTLPQGKTCVTIFTTFRKQRSWGFYVDGGTAREKWVFWREYLASIGDAALEIDE